MYKLIQKNQKKFLAVFGVLLMIVFILPTSFKNNATRGDIPVGTMDGEKIYGNDLAEARNDLEFLIRERFEPLQVMGGIGQKWRQNDEGLLTYVLLQKEAQKLGMVISAQNVEKAISQGFQETTLPKDALEEQASGAVRRFLLVESAFNRVADAVKVSKPLSEYYLAQEGEEATLNLVEYSADEFLAKVPDPTPEQIRQQYERYADAVPSGTSLLTTEPSATGYRVPERVKVQYLELPREAVVQSVLKDLSDDERYHLEVAAYEYYLNHQDDYKIPLPTRPALEAGPPAPSTGPTTKPFDATVKADLVKRLLKEPSLSSADIVEAVRARVGAREKELRSALHDQLAKAYLEWAPTHPDGSSATQPAVPATNPLIVIYPGLDFLTAFADKFEIQYGVRPLVNSLANGWLTREDLAAAKDIGRARHDDTSFAEYALHDLPAAAPTTMPATAPATTQDAGLGLNDTFLLPETGPTTAATTTPASAPSASVPDSITFTRVRPPTAPTTGPIMPPDVSLAESASSTWRPVGTGLRPFEPSDLLLDSAGNAYVFRLTAFEPAHKPTLAEALPQIVKDLKSAAALQRARDEANKLLTAARHQADLQKKDKNSDTKGLPAVAKAYGRKVITAGPFQPNNLSRSFTGYTVNDLADKGTFFRELTLLTKQLTPDNLHPSAAIELPSERKVLVAELGDLTLPVPPAQVARIEAMMAWRAKSSLEMGRFVDVISPGFTNMITDWFDYNNVVARVKYVRLGK